MLKTAFFSVLSVAIFCLWSSNGLGMNTQEESKRKEEQCSICLDPLVSSDTKRMYSAPCQHIFHTDCIEKWLSRKQQCPLCRAVIPIQKSIFSKILDYLLAAFSEESTLDNEFFALNYHLFSSRYNHPN